MGRRKEKRKGEERRERRERGRGERRGERGRRKRGGERREREEEREKIRREKKEEEEKRRRTSGPGSFGKVETTRKTLTRKKVEEKKEITMVQNKCPSLQKKLWIFGEDHEFEVLF